MEIPQSFREKIPRLFRDTGAKWLESLDDTLSQCTKRWHLTELQLINELSINLVYFAKSTEYGEVVLKLCPPSPGLHTEIQVLGLYQGRNICTLLDFDTGLGALLLERILPGEDLTSVESLDERLAIAVPLIRDLPIPLQSDCGLPTYQQWMERAFAKVRAEAGSSHPLRFLIAEAERLWEELEKTERPRVILHGDLHHMNILKAAVGRWKAIDPQGVIGVPCLEVGRYILNQLGMVEPSDRFSCMNQMTNAFGEALGESERTIAICGFLDNVLSASWSFEDNDGPFVIAAGVDQAHFLLQFLKG